MNAYPTGFGGGSAAFTLKPITQIEDMYEAVRHGLLTVMQYSRKPFSGGLAIARDGDVTCCAGRIDGYVGIQGPLSCNRVTLGLGLYLPKGDRQWAVEVGTGDVGIFHAGDEHDGLYREGSSFAAVALPLDLLEQYAAREGFVLDVSTLGGTGIHGQKLSPDVLVYLQDMFNRIHSGVWNGAGATEALLRALIGHLGRLPDSGRRQGSVHHSVLVFRRAQSYIHANLSHPMTLDQIAEGANASRRTVYRAFTRVLDLTPQAYIRQLRLNRIRAKLVSETERTCTITVVANEWGIGELGRFAGWYRELFGELPSQTLRRQLPAGAFSNIANRALSAAS